MRSSIFSELVFGSKEGSSILDLYFIKAGFSEEIFLYISWNMGSKFESAKSLAAIISPPYLATCSSQEESESVPALDFKSEFLCRKALS